MYKGTYTLYLCNMAAYDTDGEELKSVQERKAVYELKPDTDGQYNDDKTKYVAGLGAYGTADANTMTTTRDTRFWDTCYAFRPLLKGVNMAMFCFNLVVVLIVARKHHACQPFVHYMLFVYSLGLIAFCGAFVVTGCLRACYTYGCKMYNRMHVSNANGS